MFKQCKLCRTSKDESNFRKSRAACKACESDMTQRNKRKAKAASSEKSAAEREEIHMLRRLRAASGMMV
jgi:protein required for attachment to host cells